MQAFAKYDKKGCFLQMYALKIIIIFDTILHIKHKGYYERNKR